MRARWEDGTPAYTIKTFGVVNRYDLSEEFPALTLRPTAIKSAMDEILWIWQRKSNNIHDLKPHIWDEWADADGSIGKAYGYQMAQKYKFAQGEMDQVDNVLWQLKHQPQSRRIMTNIYNFADLSEMNLEPCAYSMTFNVTGSKLNAISGSTEYDYEINAETGEILSFDKDIENFSIPKKNNTSSGSSQTTPSSNYIGVDKAKSIALKDAGLSASSVTFTKAKLDREDGVRVYEIEFYTSTKEYEYEINAKTGKIRDKDVEYFDDDDDDDWDDDDWDDDWDD